jgi:histidyl-tRNA synthetase
VNQFTWEVESTKDKSSTISKSKNKINNMKFQTPKGTRDLMPEDAARMQKIIETVRSVYEQYGFCPLITPAFESFDLLSAKGGLGEAVKDEIYYFKDKGGREMGLRFDLTMPLTRVVSSNPQMPKPVKLYSISRVWRYDNPQAMRYREFWQADVDILGSKSVYADAEVIAVACKALEKLGFKDFKIRVNDRRMFDDFLKSINVGDAMEVFRTVDKLEKIGEDGVVSELKDKGLDDRNIEKIMKFLKSGSKLTKKGLLNELLKKLAVYGCKKYIMVDASLTRGLDYYTSVVFEINLGANVSCGGGGRYNRLVKSVGGGDVPATGISLGLDRILEVMKERDMFGKESSVKAFVANVDDTLKDSIKIAEKLRKKNIACQTNLMAWNLSKQLEYADRVGIPYVIIVGEKELKSKKFKLRDMKKKTEEELELREIIKRLK